MLIKKITKYNNTKIKYGNLQYKQKRKKKSKWSTKPLAPIIRGYIVSPQFSLDML